MFEEGGIDRNRFKLRGEWVELLFMARAAEHGLRMIKPWGDSSRYDLVVETGGRFVRVQVKSTSHRRSNFYVCSLLRCAQQRHKIDEIDFFAIYVIPVDSWYIMPSSIASRTTGGIALSPHNSLSKHAVYREAWHLLGGQ
jgi:hypothetical protein